MGLAGIGTAGAGSIISTLGNLLKKKAKVPEFKEVNAGQEAANAIRANTSNLQGAQELASRTNEFSQEELLKAIRSVVPNFDSLAGKVSQQIESQVSGKLPQEEINRIFRQTASSNVAGGTAGSGFGYNLTNRDIGRSVVDQIQIGIGNANQWLANTRQNLTAPQFDVTSMFITPAQQIAVTTQNNANRFNVDWLTNQVNAANATRTIVGNGINQFGASLGSMGSLGGIMGGGATGGGGGTGAFTGGLLGAGIGGG